METVTNLVSGAAGVASRAIWGEAENEQKRENETLGKEPLSGVVGDVKSGEPYDKGNAEDSTIGTDRTSTLTSNPKVTDTTAPSVPSASEGLVQKKEDPTVPAPSTTSTTSVDATLVSELPDRPIEVFETGPSTGIQDIKPDTGYAMKHDITKSIDEQAATSAAVAGLGTPSGMEKEKESVGTGAIKSTERLNNSAFPETTPFKTESSTSLSTAAPSTTAPSTTAPSTTAPSTTAHSTTAPSTTAPSTTAPSTTAPSTTAHPVTTLPESVTEHSGSASKKSLEESGSVSPDTPGKKSLKEKIGLEKLKAKLHIHKESNE
ncbi:hypothetical protein MBM_01030 [Drepanopeziza brunnea f. sp. 'multigermtubi' MB_m1]|uniref:Uncharacterized protein n=1 Tax=Marssonina brunnea f. sp. multigermtubi (strain MB_m1) TaxID=1072389 RepID=K1XHV7_MARBU|nr:uncharacterized protein MBM_01030 [Drepanopeziza brunnea f. sp. 'multigermtubi' MB_m1]EKD20348.1 hypothetical protein MBM_01030 [Drepanopeziza brunnea f. sp. 'multigermtubi' MB_m1]